MVLLNNVSVDTTSDSFGPRGGKFLAIVRGDNFGGGTVALEVGSKTDNVVGPRFAALENGAFTANATYNIDHLPAGSLIRAVLSGSSGASNIFVEIIQ